MRPKWRAWALAGLLALVGALELGASRAQAQFPIFFGGDVLLPDGRKLGTPPGRPRRREDYPVGSIGYANSPSRPSYAPPARTYAAPIPGYTSAPQPYSYAPQTYYAPQPRYYAPQPGYYYPQQPAYRRYYR